MPRVLVADPPWSFGDKLGARGAGANYDLLSQREIEEFSVPPLGPDALLFLWRVSSQPEEALRVARAWGFDPKSELVWVKLSPTKEKIHFGMGHYVRMSHESCLIAARGRGKDLIRDHSTRSVFFAPVGKHSAKPDEFYSLVERLTPGPYVELFARRSRPGWDCWGNEFPEGRINRCDERTT